MDGSKRIERALLSVSDKTGIVEFARLLVSFGTKIISTGGTASVLRNAGIDVTDVSDVTGFPEMMGGRVKTLHPKIHGGLLALRDEEEHVQAMKAHGIDAIDLVVINLYPFEKTVADPDVSLEDAVENIDIGGPTMIRSAAKNWRDVAVVTDPALYESVAGELIQNDGSLSLATRQRLAVLAYTRTAAYDLSISSYLAGQLSEADLEQLEPHNPLGGLMFIESEELAVEDAADPPEIAEADESKSFRTVSGCISQDRGPSLRREPASESGFVFVRRRGRNRRGRTAPRQGNVLQQLRRRRCRFKPGSRVRGACRRHHQAHQSVRRRHGRQSRGGLRACALDRSCLGIRRDRRAEPKGRRGHRRGRDQIFTEVVLAPGFDDDALELFRSKKNLRVLRVSLHEAGEDPGRGMRLKQISGGMLVQTEDDILFGPGGLKIVTEKQPTPSDLDAMGLAWKVCKHVKSNAIVIADPFQTIGVGSGQMNRIDSLRIAAIRAERFGLPTAGAALASDAFFPFRDSVDEAAKLGISAIIQPGGSLKDDESIAAANEHGIVMAFTGVRHFDH
ncbi:MAG: bifunctional phosphoribosylaminoimidazolecarboxamide formyltransferase/IMP cyclohydrolase [Chloracidobacterium sp.]|nr:bifunctional phosphoribosylaminoimidazolecarboxamide formyltransferase/IMP cyclohydrolase [Chloracidobacterium sp.]